MNLHEFLLNFAHVGNGFFETTFSIEIGNKHARENSFNYEGMNVVFSNWHLELCTQTRKIDYTITILIVGSILRIELIFKE
jgi:hypothetical protein